LKSFWDTRYDTGYFVYGKAPNGFFAASIERHTPGRMLLPGEGEGRNAVHAAILGWEEVLKPGGTLILEAFHTSQLGKNTGGPGALEMLFDEKILLGDFSLLTTEMVEEQAVTLSEGLFHQGEARLIRYIGRKQSN
jgi:hypothetical protein